MGELADLLPGKRAVAGSFSNRKCRVCGCTDRDCRQCIKKTGSACHWVEEDLCSACAPMKVICKRCGSTFNLIRVAGENGGTTLAREDDPRVCPAYCTQCGGKVLEKVNA